MRLTGLVAFAAIAAGAAIASADGGQCEIALEGGLGGSARAAANPGTVATDYWMSDQEQRAAVEVMVGLSTKDPVEKKRKVEARMAREPHFMLLVVNCDTDVASVSLLTTDDSGYKDIPFGPGKLRIGPSGNRKKGELTSLVAIKGQKGYWRVDGEGELEIQAWDGKHIAGVAKIPLDSEGKKALLTATFDLPCRGLGKCK